MEPGTKILAVGNSRRGDDGVGPYVLAGLAGRLPEADLLSSDGEVTGLLAIFERCPKLVLIDAVECSAAGLKPGEIVRLDCTDPALAEAGLRSSTHAMGVAEAIGLARALGALPETLTVIAVAGDSFAIGEGLSAPVARAADALVEELVREAAHA